MAPTTRSSSSRQPGRAASASSESPSSSRTGGARRRLEFASSASSAPARGKGKVGDEEKDPDRRKRGVGGGGTSKAAADFFAPRRGGAATKKRRVSAEEGAEKVGTPDRNARERHAAATTPNLVEDDGRGRGAKRAEGDEREEDEVEFEPVQTYSLPHLYENLGYRRMGDSDLSEETRKCFRFVVHRYEIPDNFETDRSFGPWSGSSFEERVLTAYELGQLKPKHGAETAGADEDGVEDGELSICTFCADLGHRRRECPGLV